jgi:hypothetical protein
MAGVAMRECRSVGRLTFGGTKTFTIAFGGVTGAAENAVDTADIVDGFSVLAKARLFSAVDFHLD